MGFATVDEEAALDHKRARAYPEGWFQAAYSDELACGEVQRLRYFGQELVLFRTAGGAVQLADAYCAHLGAHLGVGGTVSGEHLVCPFHAWEYGLDGHCKAIPYSDHIPARGAAIRVWPTRERSGIILFWHSPTGRPSQWEPPELREYDTPDWGTYFLRQRYRIRTTCHEIAENIADSAHGKYVHGAAQIPVVHYSTDGHRFLAEFHNDLPSVGHKAINHVIVHGLGLVENRSSGAGEKAFISAYTPIDRDHVDVWFSMLARGDSKDETGVEISRSSARATLREFEKDIPIWEAKIYRHVPALVKDDGPIGRYRMWARQFFERQSGEHSGRSASIAS